MASVGKHIKRLRTAKHMTQEQLAEKLFVTRQAVSAAMTTSVGGLVCSPSHYYTQSSMVKSGNFFGFYLFPPDTYEHGFMLTDQLDAQKHIVTVTVSGLTRMTTARLPYISRFS